MRGQNFRGKRFDIILGEIYYDINLLYILPCTYARNLVLNHLRDRVSMLGAIIGTTDQPVQLQTQTLLLQETTSLPQALTAPIHQIVQGNQTTFTLEQLSRFDGKNGNPAYVAVNGTVYDVTNNAAWAAATHFGLTAGNDQTASFASCHAGQPTLNKLKVVGKLVQNE